MISKKDPRDKHLIRYFSAFICAVAMILCLIPITVNAENTTSVYVGGVELNATNPYLVSGVAASSGTLGTSGCTAYFDSTSATLTLNDATINTAYDLGIGANKDKVGIFANNDLTIKLVGSNTINGVSAGSGRSSYGIYIDSGSLTIKNGAAGDSTGSLTANGYGDINQTWSVGIYAYNGIAISSGTVAAYGNQATMVSSGIQSSFGSVTITGGTVSASGKSASYANGIKGTTITISGGNVKAQAAGGIRSNGAFSVAPTLNYVGGYQWRTSSSDSYTQSVTTAYYYSTTHTFVDIMPVDYTMDFTKDSTAIWYLTFPNTNLTTTDASGDGWSWDASEKLLTLSGLNFTTTANTAIKLPDGAKMTLQNGTTNTVKSGDVSIGSSIGINGLGTLAISGEGTLNVSGGKSSAGSSFGIKSVEALTISGGSITAQSGNASSDVYGIHSLTTITISDGTVTAIGETSTNLTSYGIYAGTSIAIAGGHLYATGNTEALSLLASSTMTPINGVIGSIEYDAQENTLSTVTWNANTKKYYIGNNVAKTLLIGREPVVTPDPVNTDDNSSSVLWTRNAIISILCLAGGIVIKQKKSQEN